ncbi:hypothetical protein [Hymenobacter sp. BT491]|uniref:hypothetical protein n=1 Tax=Hymenobacter sp. BT491 TaxID=2766779 RepID=UPI0016537259|nr:hypothetical protein [Hymenobacter sp. BT491]MBC6988928.1 hypothetical protein [Hymenobacter sp. BT491]
MPASSLDTEKLSRLPVKGTVDPGDKVTGLNSLATDPALRNVDWTADTFKKYFSQATLPYASALAASQQTALAGVIPAFYPGVLHRITRTAGKRDVLVLALDASHLAVDTAWEVQADGSLSPVAYDLLNDLTSARSGGGGPSGPVPMPHYVQDVLLGSNRTFPLTAYTREVIGVGADKNAALKRGTDYTVSGLGTATPAITFVNPAFAAGDAFWLWEVFGLADSAGAGGGVFAQDIPVSLANGRTFGRFVNGDTIPATGKTANEVILLAAVEYLAPGFTTFAIQGTGNQDVEVGTPFAAGFKSFTWATSQAGNVAANSISVTDVTSGAVLATGEANDGTLSASTQAFTAVKGESRRYRIAAQSTQGTGFSADLVYTGYYKSYFGYSTSPSLSATQLVALGNGQLQSGRARTVSGVTAAGGAYTYYAYEASSGDLSSIILDGAAPVLGAFTRLPDATGTNALGAPVTLRVYRSNAVNAFTNNSLAFS